VSEDPWYAERRARWKPDKVRLLLIAESAPDDGGDESSRRFFHNDALTGRDGLFRQVVQVLFGRMLPSCPHVKPSQKEQPGQSPQSLSERIITNARLSVPLTLRSQSVDRVSGPLRASQVGGK
jgi:hypothetical protein